MCNVSIQGVSLTGNGVSLVSDGRCKQYTHLAPHSRAQKFSRRVAQGCSSSVFFVCVVSKTFIISPPDFPITEHSYLIFSVAPFTLAFHFHSADWTLVWPTCRTVSVDRTPTHNTHLCSTVCSQARNAQLTRLAQDQEFHCLLCASEKNLVIWCVAHVSSLVVSPASHHEHFIFLSLAFHHEHFIFLIHSSFCDT